MMIEAEWPAADDAAVEPVLPYFHGCQIGRQSVPTGLGCVPRHNRFGTVQGAQDDRNCSALRMTCEGVYGGRNKRQQADSSTQRAKLALADLRMRDTHVALDCH